MVVCPIVREKDGLAMSSRNVYLTPSSGSRRWCCIARCMRVQSCGRCGRARCRQADRKIGKSSVSPKSLAARLDYFAIVDPETLDPVAGYFARRAGRGRGCISEATRLIDNILLTPRR